MRSNLLSYVMESVANGQMEQAVEFLLRNKRTRPDKILDTFHALMAATARELEK